MKTVKLLFVALFAISALLSSCKDEDTNFCSDGIKNGTESRVDCGGDCEPCINDYFFEITYSGNTHRLDNDFFQRADTWHNEFGGLVSGDNIFTSDNLSIVFYFSDTVQNVNLENELIGKSIYFNNFDGPFPLVDIKHSGWSFSRYSERGLDSTTYKVDVSEVTYLRNENALFDIDVYAVRGTFTTRIEDENEEYTDAHGSFFLQCSHGNY